MTAEEIKAVINQHIDCYDKSIEENKEREMCWQYSQRKYALRVLLLDMEKRENETRNNRETS